jgi:ubiquinone/menaquinone biosynthesis C-methylase UbiE
MFQPGGPTFLELARQALSSTERGYDLLAPKFELTPFRTPDEILVPSIAKLAPADRVLDVCCGTGTALRLLEPLARHALVGLDFSAGMLAEAAKVEGARLVRANALAMPFDSAFDLAVCFGALGHFVGEDEARLVASLARALVRGGRFAFVTSESPPPLSLRSLVYRGFKAAMHVRNAFLRPPFVMCYLTFPLPGVLATLSRHGLKCQVVDPGFLAPFRHGRLVIAAK